MIPNLPFEDKINYRTLYGKLFSVLLKRFGVTHISEIEDAIQNSFLKYLKIRKQNNIPKNIENWLFIVARNDLLNIIKRKQKEDYNFSIELTEDEKVEPYETDLRLQTILFISSLNSLSTQSKIIFILKNIFGLSMLEIRESTLINQEAIYKSINRTKKKLNIDLNCKKIEINSVPVNQKTISIVEEILYAVFNIGFDSFSEKTENIVNKDLCLESFVLTRLLYNKFNYISTSNLLAVLFFHISRIPAKINNGKLISFFNQNRDKWNKKLLTMAFHHIKKPQNNNKYYIEAIIISKYMSKKDFSLKDWTEISYLYEMMLEISQSPIVRLNYSFCLSKIGKKDKAMNILSEVQNQLPDHHLYFSLVKAIITKESNPKESHDIILTLSNKMNQKIRKEYLKCLS